jgi:hypothetical protein
MSAPAISGPQLRVLLAEAKVLPPGSIVTLRKGEAEVTIQIAGTPETSKPRKPEPW